MNRFRPFRFRPHDPDASITIDMPTGAAITRGFCAKLTCGRVAWRFKGEPTGRLCEQCFDEECDYVGVRRPRDPGTPRTGDRNIAW